MAMDDKNRIFISTKLGSIFTVKRRIGTTLNLKINRVFAPAPLLLEFW